jgi:outer membrane putative beta-barrel porin/alpha-amylase
MNRLIFAAVFLMLPAVAPAQELEPGAYWPLPSRLNVFTAVGGGNWGDVNFDPSLPVDDASAKIRSAAFVFTRAFGLAGRSANASVVLPVLSGHVQGFYLGEPAEVDRFGLGDPKLKIGVNLFGAPAMTPREFASYQQQLIVGVSFTAMPPLGEYDSTKVINLGTNRWSFKPEVGLSQTYGKWVVEGMFGVWFFTDNTQFTGTRTREQDPILATQFHFTRRFSSAMWLAADANFYTGGRTSVDGKQNLDLQKNSRIGATFSKGLGGGHAIRASVSRGAYTTIGADFTSIAVGYNYAWVQ